MATDSEKMEIEELKNMGVGQIFEREKEKEAAKLKKLEKQLGPLPSARTLQGQEERDQQQKQKQKEKKKLEEKIYTKDVDLKRLNNAIKKFFTYKKQFFINKLILL